jgi:hypothetical protein
MRKTDRTRLKVILVVFVMLVYIALKIITKNSSQKEEFASQLIIQILLSRED